MRIDLFANKLARHCFLFLTITILTPSLYGQETTLNTAWRPGWKLAFNDEFQTPDLDRTKWLDRTPWGPWWEGNLQYQTPNGNLHFDRGKAIITAKQEEYTGLVYAWDSVGNFTPYYRSFDYTSAMLYSRQDFKHGWFECRFKAGKGNGLNAAFWLYGEQESEIDIFEIKGSDPFKAYMTLHWEKDDPLVGTSQWQSTIISGQEGFHEAYNTFAVHWTEEELDWYLNNQKVEENSFTEFIRGRNLPEVPLNAILTFGVGGFGGNPDSTTSLPEEFGIDYVRIYKQDPTPAPFITGQENTPHLHPGDVHTLQPKDIRVEEFYGVYPSGFRFSVMEGAHYSLTDSNTIEVEQTYTGWLNIPVRVHDGVDSSNVYPYQIEVTERPAPVGPQHAFAVYPVPVTGTLTIDIAEAQTPIQNLEIFDWQGRKVYSLSDLHTRQLKLPPGTMQSGVHVLRIRYNNDVKVVKVLVE